MNTPNTNQACQSGQNAAGSAEKMTTAQIAKALGASGSVLAGQMATHEQVAWYHAIMHQQHLTDADVTRGLEQEMRRYLSLVKEGKAGGELAESLADTDETPEDGFLPPEEGIVHDCGTTTVSVAYQDGGRSLICIVRNLADWKIGEHLMIRRRRDFPAMGKVV
ncbi:MAG: hypothetical protein HYS57_00370 [Parcubacteria group bacterium]|nr:hypothetical protein [Parcubacteria group bacterium]